MARSWRTDAPSGVRNRSSSLIAGLWSALVLCVALPPATALGADRLYWANAGNGTISFANVDGSGGGQLPIPSTALDVPVGVAIDTAKGRIYWANEGNELGGDPGSIFFANLDGSGPTRLLTGAATVANPAGVAIDPVTRRIYWANNGGDTISFADLDGGGGGDLQTSGTATVATPAGVMVEPGQRVYWTNTAIGAEGLSFLSLNAPGGADFDTGSAPVGQPQALALDPTARKVYWVNVDGTISFADLLDPGDGKLDIATSTVGLPAGIALDPGAGKLYWSDDTGGGSIASASLTGSAAAKLSTPGAVLNAPTFLALLRAPQGQAPPAIGGGSQVGAVLSCSQGTWAADLTSAFLYRAPQTFAFQWSLNGADVPGAVAGSLRTAAAGDYRCRVTASNAAGDTAQTSAPAHVNANPNTTPVVITRAFGTSTRVTLALGAARISARGPVRVRIVNANPFVVSGTLSAQTAKPVAAAHKRRVRLAAKRLTVPAGASRTASLTLPATLRRLLARQHSLSLALTVAVADPAGHRRTVSRTLVVRLLVKRR